MKHLAGVLIALVVATLTGCQDVDPPTNLTGYETTYELVAASAHDVKGIVTFKERTDGFTTVVISVSGTGGDAKHPVHLHLGGLSTPDADVAAVLNPVVAYTGRSETILTSLANETPITYASLNNLEACVKIHLSDSGPERTVVLAGGNIGEAYILSIKEGKPAGIPSCKSSGD